MGDLLCLVLGVALLAIIARALLSWFPNARDSGFARIVDRVTDPVIVPTMGLGVLAAVLASRITRRRLVNRTLALAAGP